MISLISVLFLQMATFFSTPTITPAATGTVVVNLEGVRPEKGVVRVALYKENKFLSRGGEIFEDTRPADGTGTHKVVFENVPYGTYALGSYQDFDNDASLSRSAIGIPKEPYGFSKPLVSKWRAPKFDEVSFELNQSSVSHKIVLKTWGQY